MAQKKIFLFIGTTAELIKLVPVIRELNRQEIKFTVIASGQNDIHFEEFATEIGNIEISYAVTPKGKDPSLILFAIWSVRTFFSLTIGLRFGFQGLNKSNSLLIVHGDTVSSLLGSLVATLYGLKLVHIESGLRSFNFLEPFPEEICRYIISMLADVHFCPNAWALNNLKSSKGEKINIKQNTLIETFWSAIKTKNNHSLIRRLKREKIRYFVLVTHRQEHVLFGRKTTTDILKYVLNAVPKNLKCIFLVHDLSVNFIYELGKVLPQEIVNRMIRIERLPYGDFMHLLKGSEFMITDGGSNQEEMYYMGKPCLLLRKYTERIEGLNKNVLLSENKRSKIIRFINSYDKYNQLPIKIHTNPSTIIVDHLFNHEIS